MSIDLSDLLSDVLDDYSTELCEAVNTETEKAAMSLKKAIAADAPVSTGKQKRSWRVTTEKIAGANLKATVHSTDYRKVHLLELGHLTRSGTTRTKAVKYIGTNTDNILSQYEQDVVKAIKAVK